MNRSEPATSGPSAFLDEPEGTLFSRMRWLTPKRLAFFMIFWIAVFFAGSFFINNPFAGSAGASNWDLGGGFPNYYWVVMYLHGLNTGLVGLAALVACDFFDLPSLRVRRGITGGVLVAGILSPIGAVVNTTAPWTSVGLWIQVVAFLALDEILVLFLWGMLEVWRAGEPRSRTLPFLTAGLTGVTMLVAALIGHLAGTILGFGDNPPILGWYATQEMGESLNDFAAGLIGAHSYLMITAVPAGVVSLVAVRFGYFRLEGRMKQLAQLGLILVCLDLVLQMAMALLAGFSPWPGDLPPQITSAPGVPAFLALNDAVDFAFLVLGGFLVLGALVVGSGRLKGWKMPTALPLRVLPLLMMGIFTVLTFATEPTGDSAVGTPPQAWLRLFVAFYLTMLVALVALLAERVLGDRYQMRIGWTATAGSLAMFAGVMDYLYTNAVVGGYLAAAGLALVGLSLVSTSWWGLSPSRDAQASSAPRPVRSIFGSPRGTFTLLAAVGILGILLAASAGFLVGPAPLAPSAPSGGGGLAVEYVNSTVAPVPGGGHAMFSPGNFTVQSNATVVFTFVVYDTRASDSTLSASVVQGTVNGTEELTSAPGAAPQNVSVIPLANLSHTFTIVIGTTVINIPLPAATASGVPATVVASVVFNQTGKFLWSCDPFCMSGPITPGDGMSGWVTVT